MEARPSPLPSVVESLPTTVDRQHKGSADIRRICQMGIVATSGMASRRFLRKEKKEENQ